MARLRLVPHTAPPAPRSRAILRLAPRQASLVEEIGRLPVTAVASTVSQHLAAPGLGTLARAHGLELLVEPEAWRNQAPPTARPTSFAHCGYALGSAFDPDRHALSAGDERAYLRATLEAQVAARATRLVAPFHRSGGPASPSRSLDLRLAQRAVDVLPQLDRDPVRRLYVGLAVSAPQVCSPLDRAWLASRYGSLPVGGFLVTFPDLTERSAGAEVAGAAELLAALRDAGAGEILVATAATLALPSVATGLADAAVLATDRVYHAASLRRISPEASNAALRRAEALFASAPCSCRDHRRDVPPGRGSGRRLHTATALALDFAGEPTSVDASDEAYLRRLERADELARETGYALVPRSVLAVLEVARRAERRRARRQLA